MRNFTFKEFAWEEYLHWQTSDKAVLRKLNALLKETARSPFDGRGKPEPLKGDLSGKWSRRITDKDRLVYSVEDEVIIIYQCKGHYEDN